MDGSHCCVACGAALGADDGHDLCPACLGLDHLREALSDDACMNCRYMPRAVRVERLAQFSPTAEPDLPPSGQVLLPRSKRSKRPSAAAAGAGPRAKKAKPDKGLSAKVEQLSAELDAMRSLIQARNLDPSRSEAGFVSPAMPSLSLEGDVRSLAADGARCPLVPSLNQEDDVLSLAASASHFCDDVAQSSRASETGSFSSAHSMASDTEGSMQEVMRQALHCLRIDVPQPEQSSSSSGFFRRGRPPPSFVVPPSSEYLRELHACWRDPGACSRLSADGRVLASMHDAAAAGLDRAPPVEPGVASLIVSPEEALRQDVRCPNSQCRITDEIVCRAYNAGARAGRLGNSLAHLLFAVSASLQGIDGATTASGFGDAALQAFALMTRELGRVMSCLILARRQVWLAQSSLSEASRRTLRSVPVEPGQMFGSAALDALERTVQARQTRQHLSGLSRSMGPPPPQRSRRLPSAPLSLLPPRDWTGVGRGPPPRSGGDFRGSRQPARQPRASDSGRRPPRPPRGRGPPRK